MAQLHHHAELQLVLARDAVLLRLQLIHVPFAVNEAARCPRPMFFREPDTNSPAESNVVFEHYIYEVSLIVDIDIGEGSTYWLSWHRAQTVHCSS